MRLTVMSDKEFYIKGTGWVTWDEAHALGFTHARPAILTVYTEDLKSRQLIQCKDDIDYNKVYDSVNHTWTDDLTQLGLIRQIGNVELYTGSSSSTYFCYSTSVSEDIPTHVKVNNSLISYNELYSTKGMTSYPCKDFFVEDGNLYVWFDSTKSLYWDDRSGKKLWSNIVPEIDTAREPEDIVIKMHPSSIELCPQWEYDLSQMPIRSRTFKFDSQDADYYDKPDKLISGYSNIRNWSPNTEPTIQQSYCCPEQYDKLFEPSSQITDFNYVQSFALLDNPAVNFYPDQIYLDTDMFVLNESGIDSYDDTHYDYGDIIADTSKKEVWVDADEDTYFWRGTSSYLFPKTHDDNHQEMYFIPRDVNFTFMDDLYNDGYTTEPGFDVEIFDESLLGVRLWEDTMTLYFTPDKSPINLPVLDGNPHQAYFRAPGYSGTFYILASEANLVSNNYVVTVSYYDSWSSRSGTYVAITDSSTSTTLLDETRITNGWSSVNSEFVDFSNVTGDPSVMSGGSRSFKLSGGTDGSISCIPLYYEDGTQVPISDYIGYNATEIVSKYYLSSVAPDSYSTSTDVSNISNLRFVNKDGFVYLSYDSTEPIDNVINIKFKWNNNGSIN